MELCPVERPKVDLDDSTHILTKSFAGETLRSVSDTDSILSTPLRLFSSLTQAELGKKRLWNRCDVIVGIIMMS